MESIQVTSRLIMRELNESRDTLFEFNIGDEYDVDRAKQFFEKKLTDGFKAYYVDPFGLEESEMPEFDPQSGKIIFLPNVQTTHTSTTEG
jgi:hypothetical protein